MSRYSATAPGKVLIIGGYMVLDRPNKGLVIALTSRLHCHVESMPSTSGVFKTM
jgi:phosphomevalonate kinase